MVLLGHDSDHGQWLHLATLIRARGLAARHSPLLRATGFTQNRTRLSEVDLSFPLWHWRGHSPRLICRDAATIDTTVMGMGGRPCCPAHTPGPRQGRGIRRDQGPSPLSVLHLFATASPPSTGATEDLRTQVTKVLVGINTEQRLPVGDCGSPAPPLFWAFLEDSLYASGGGRGNMHFFFFFDNL